MYIWGPSSATCAGDNVRIRLAQELAYPTNVPLPYGGKDARQYHDYRINHQLG